MCNFDFNSARNTTIFTNNPNYVRKIVEDAFKSEGRKQPVDFFRIAGDCGNGKVAVIVDLHPFIRVSRRVSFRAKNQSHSVVIFPEFTGMSNPDWVRANFNRSKGKWSWNE